ncbi:MAG: hypothetical protein EA420_15995 [Candidatus Competibacteraceae bacterium]|nr:MAG: hypothetical protein EA420_15995 [Candidatus Competibacteraceae bacterium]
MAPLSIQDVVAKAVDNPRSYFYGTALTALLRYREGQGAANLETARGYLDLLIKLETPDPAASSPFPSQE